jgi:hypothetical protein
MRNTCWERSRLGRRAEVLATLHVPSWVSLSSHEQLLGAPKRLGEGGAELLATLPVPSWAGLSSHEHLLRTLQLVVYEIGFETRKNDN